MTELNLSPGPPPFGVEPTSEARPRSRWKSSAIALLLSTVIPGLGQLYNRQPRKGLWIAVTIPLLGLLAGKTRIFLSFWGLVAFFVILGGWRLFIVGEAAYVAWTGRKPEPAFRNPRITVSVIAGIIVLVGLLPTPEQHRRMYSYFRAFVVHSDSMCPTICQGERIVADMDAFKTKAPQRGDIIVFQQKSFDELWNKRVIGIGGDLVEPGPKGTILVDGKALSATQTCGAPVLQKDVPEEIPDFPSTRVPEGSFFVVGDNLGRSFDSRIWFGQPGSGAGETALPLLVARTFAYRLSGALGDGALCGHRLGGPATAW